MEVSSVQILLSTLLLFITLTIHNVSGHCWQIGMNPGFTSTPRVEQLRIDLVRVSWEGIVSKRKCADNFLVKYWPRSAPNEYFTTELIPKDVDYVDIEVTPKLIYQFQAVAREDKGSVGGVDWNKSPTVDFRTVSQEYRLSQLAEDGSGGSSTSSGAPRRVRASILGLSLEVFVGLVVISLIAILIIVGLIYRFCCSQKKVRGEYDVEREERDVDHAKAAFEEDFSDDEVDEHDDEAIEKASLAKDS